MVFITYSSETAVMTQIFGTRTTCILRRGLVSKAQTRKTGYKQSSREWFERFKQVIKKHGYKQTQSDDTLFFKHSSDGKITIIIVYVDDMIITGDDYVQNTNVEKLD